MIEAVIVASMRGRVKGPRIIVESQNDPINLDVYFNEKVRMRRNCTHQLNETI